LFKVKLQGLSVNAKLFTSQVEKDAHIVIDQEGGDHHGCPETLLDTANSPEDHTFSTALENATTDEHSQR